LGAAQFNANPYSYHNYRGRNGRTEKKEPNEGIATDGENEPARRRSANEPELITGRQQAVRGSPRLSHQFRCQYPGDRLKDRQEKSAGGSQNDGSPWRDIKRERQTHREPAQ
jgi:hypothetical protein